MFTQPVLELQEKHVLEMRSNLQFSERKPRLGAQNPLLLCIIYLCYRRNPKLAVSRKRMIKARGQDLVIQKASTAPCLTLMQSKGSQTDTQIRTG